MLQNDHLFKKHGDAAGLIPQGAIAKEDRLTYEQRLALKYLGVHKIAGMYISTI